VKEKGASFLGRSGNIPFVGTNYSGIAALKGMRHPKL
jgi:hypothetical protein